MSNGNRRTSNAHNNNHNNNQDKWKTLPSLAVESNKLHSSSVSDFQFANITPVFRRTRFDLFGVAGMSRQVLAA